MICKNCGSQVNPAIGFCPNCKQSVDISELNKLYQSMNNVPQQPMQPMNNVVQQPVQPMNNVPQQPVQPMNNVPQQPMPPMNNVPQQPVQPMNNVVQQPVQPMNNVVQQPVQPMNNVAQQPVQPMNNVAQQPVQPMNNVAQQPMPPMNNVPQQPVQPMNNVPQQPMQPINNTPQKSKKKNKLKIILPILFAIVLVAFLGIAFFSKNKDEFNSVPNELNVSSGTRTIMIYMIGSDLESKYGQGTLDIEEIMDSEFDTNDLNIVIYAGGSKKWKNDFESTENAIYEINGDKIEKVKTYNKKDMTNSNTLTEFIDYVYENYESDLYSLVLWDHGGGPLYGYGYDENYENSSPMTLIELDKAINSSQLMKETKFEFIGFDACLMSSIELANILKEEANYLIASSETIPGDGWDYTFLNEISSKTSSEEFGKIIIDQYYEYYKDGQYYYGYKYIPQVTLSLIDLSKIDALVESIDVLFEDMDASINVSSYSKISRGVSKAVMYGYVEGELIQSDLIDLYGLVDELKEYEISEVKKAIDESIIYHKSNIKNCHGISIYFPVTTKNIYNKIETNLSYNKISVSENYRSFLNKYVGINSVNKFVNSDIRTLIPTFNETNISVVLPEDVAKNYETGAYILFKKMEDGSLLPEYKSKDVVVEGNVMSATVTDRIISTSDLNGENRYDLIAYEIERDENSVTYGLPGILQDWDDEDFFGTYTSEIIDIYLKVDNLTNQGEIINIKPASNSENVAAKISYNLNDWRVIVFASSSYFLYDSNGNKLDDWQQSGTMYGTEITIADGYKIFASELNDENTYYYMFQVKDTQGNIYETNLVKAE